MNLYFKNGYNKNVNILFNFMTRIRTKECKKCYEHKDILYRCRYNEPKDWVFVCGECLKEIKNLFQNTYQYGGTWKSKKK